jgi:virginiamycin B lyase
MNVRKIRRVTAWTGALAAIAVVATTFGSSSATAATTHARPHPPVVTSYPPPPATDNPFGITLGPGGTWYAEGNLIVRIRPNGHQDIYPLPNQDTADAGWLTWAGGSQVWFADRGADLLGTIDASGRVREWRLPGDAADSAGPGAMVVLKNAVWFTDPAGSRIGRFDRRTHHFRMFSVPTAGSWPLGLTLGPDHALWFVERTAGKVGRMTLSGSFREWALDPGSFPNRIIVGPDHAIWFTELDAGLVGRITMSGRLTETAVAGGPVGIALGPDRKVYVALFTSSQLGRLDDRGNLVRTWAVPGALLVAAGRHSMWVTDTFADTVARVSLRRG